MTPLIRRTIMISEKIETLYDHYKDTCSIIKDAVKRRDRLMIIVIATLGLFALQTIFPTASSLAFNDFLNFKFGITFKLDLAIIGNIVWLLLLVFSLRYFQTATFVERQYPYLHELEDKLNKNFGENIITREGEYYLSKYPLFSNWMWVLYTIAFPLLLLIVSTIKIIGEIQNGLVDKISSNLVLNVFFFLLLLISTILYMVMIHKKKESNKNESS